MSVKGDHFNELVASSSHPDAIRELHDFMDGLGNAPEWQVMILRGLASAIEADAKEHGAVLNGLLNSLGGSDV